jgi:hypothetical protein
VKTVKIDTWDFSYMLLDFKNLIVKDVYNYLEGCLSSECVQDLMKKKYNCLNNIIINKKIVRYTIKGIPGGFHIKL